MRYSVSVLLFRLAVVGAPRSAEECHGGPGGGGVDDVLAGVVGVLVVLLAHVERDLLDHLVVIVRVCKKNKFEADLALVHRDWTVLYSFLSISY